MTLGGVVGTRNAIAVALARTNPRQVDMPDEAGVIGKRDAGLLLIAVVAAEQANLDASGIFRSDSGRLTRCRPRWRPEDTAFRVVFSSVWVGRSAAPAHSHH